MRVWWNHWFSTAYRLIELLRQGCIENNIDITIIGSNKSEKCVYKAVCDEFYVEPNNISDDDYVEWCHKFCEEHHIDVFVPRRCLEEITFSSLAFSLQGVKLLADSRNYLVSLFNDKQRTREFFEEYNICKVPEMYIVNTISEFEKAYKMLKEHNPDDRVCIKYNKDEGAVSFRVIDDVVDNIKSLRIGVGLKISYQHALEILGSVDKFDDLIVMPYLSGPEISVDSLLTKQGFIGITRYKVGSRGTQIEYNPEFYEIAKKVAEISGLKMPYNVQLRKHNDEWYLLEVNTRMAGGTHKSCLTGINIPYIAFCELLGIPYKLEGITNFSNIYLSEIETPIILK